MIVTAVFLRQRQALRNRPVYTVVFSDVNGDELLARKVYENAFAIPPDNLELSDNQVFLDWGNPLYPVHSDALCSPSIEDVSNGTNVFFVNTMYIQKNKTKTMHLQIGGNVALDELEIELLYNPNSIEFTVASSAIGDIQLLERGKAKFTLNPDESIDHPCVLADISFKSIGKKFTYSELTINPITVQHNSMSATYERMKTRVFIFEP